VPTASQQQFQMLILGGGSADFEQEIPGASIAGEPDPGGYCLPPAEEAALAARFPVESWPRREPALSARLSPLGPTPGA
jgi:hypothetical protein